MKTCVRNIKLGLALALLAAPLEAARYKIDPAHSRIEFKVRHMMVSKVTGSFDKFSGWFDYEPAKAKNWKTEAVIEAASINTVNKDRDTHLRSADFLDVEKHKTITFKLTEAVSDNNVGNKITGDLSIRGITKPVTLSLEETGMLAKDPWGQARAGFAARTVINRRDYGITWSTMLETGGAVVGDQVEITIEIEGILETAATPAPAKDGSSTPEQKKSEPQKK